MKIVKEVARPRCPECGGEGVKIGFKITRRGRKQRWLCRNCGRTFYATEAPEATPTARSSSKLSPRPSPEGSGDEQKIEDQGRG